MTAIITPELRAALERLRDFKNGDIAWEHSGEDGVENYNRDVDCVVDAMLALLPEGMPEPDEIIRVKGHPTEFTNIRTRGAFFPLEVLDGAEIANS